MQTFYINGAQVTKYSAQSFLFTEAAKKGYGREEQEIFWNNKSEEEGREIISEITDQQLEIVTE